MTPNLFKRTRIRIVIAIMAILVAVFSGTLVLIYSVSYSEVYENNLRMLEDYAIRYPESSRLDEANAFFEEPLEGLNVLDDMPFQKRGNPPVFDEWDGRGRGAIFYSVALSHDDELIQVDNSGDEYYTDDELAELAETLISAVGESEYGVEGNLMYYILDKGTYTLVSFMDNTLVQQSTSTLFRYTLIFGIAALIVLFFIAWYLARQIVRPTEQAYDKQKQFISDAGHELKTPVAAVKANAELLRREVGSNQWLDNIEYENERMSLLIGQLLDLARTESQAVSVETLDFTRVVLSEVLSMESIAFDQGKEIKTDLADDVKVKGNDLQLKQLVAILLDNALSYSPDKSPITVQLKVRGKTAILDVINQGDPIDPTVRAQLFERFYRQDSARTADQGHYGLGLSIANAIVNRHGGTISVTSENGEVDFRVELPSQSLHN